MCLLLFVSAHEKGILQLCSVLLFQSSWGKDDFKKQNKTMDFNIQQAKIWSGEMCLLSFFRLGINMCCDLQ